jgi:lipid A 3-O-deacylase PagL
MPFREIDRIFNFQHFGGFALRWAPFRGPGFTVELRNHHISNAGTAGENLGVNAGTIIAGVQWILRSGSVQYQRRDARTQRFGNHEDTNPEATKARRQRTTRQHDGHDATTIPTA